MDNPKHQSRVIELNQKIPFNIFKVLDGDSQKSISSVEVFKNKNIFGKEKLRINLSVKNQPSENGDLPLYQFERYQQEWKGLRCPVQKGYRLQKSRL